MHEFELIDRYFRRHGGSGVRLGIGDDGAVLELPQGRRLVAVVDTLVTGVHFPADISAVDIGYRAVAVNLSDIAAMGADPAWMTLALTLPAADANWLDGFAEGLFLAANEHDVALVGGDTTAGSELVVTVQLLGHVADNAWLARSGCKPGDRVYVSGTPGDAAAGLTSIQHGDPADDLAQRFLRPEARVQLGRAVAGLASAAIDVSDGLCADLGRLLLASGCGASIEQQQLPLSPALLDHCGKQAAIEFALTGGDDYELLLTVAAGNEADFLEAAATTGIAVACIGEAREEAGLVVTDNGMPVTVDVAGYRHFALE